MAEIQKAYEYADKKHAGQLRKSGEPYIIHPLAVAEIVAEIGLDTDAIVASLLHDCLEDTDASYEEISRLFGQTVAELVEGVTKLTRVQYSTMDLIAGLPGDTAESFADSLRQVLALGPSNVTVHTLALKKGADLFRSRANLPGPDEVETMLSGAEAALRRSAFEPYYLYRQKYMLLPKGEKIAKILRIREKS